MASDYTVSRRKSYPRTRGEKVKRKELKSKKHRCPQINRLGISISGDVFNQPDRSLGRGEELYPSILKAALLVQLMVVCKATPIRDHIPTIHLVHRSSVLFSLGPKIPGKQDADPSLRMILLGTDNIKLGTYFKLLNISFWFCINQILSRTDLA
jgi:hypothetical protein